MGTTYTEHDPHSSSSQDFPSAAIVPGTSIIFGHKGAAMTFFTTCCFFPMSEETKNTTVYDRQTALAVVGSQQVTLSELPEANVEQHLPPGKHPQKDANQ